MRPEDRAGIACGTAAFWRVNLCLFAAGFNVFALLYFVQPLLPVFSDEFGISAAASSLALSLTTAVMAFALFFSAIASDALGRKAIMSASLAISAGLTLVMAFVPDWSAVLIVRALMGVAISGVQAVAMAYLAEEMDADAFGLTLGIFISGSAIGGMAGRLIAAVLADFSGWRVAALALGAVALVCAVVFWRALPASRGFGPGARGPGVLRRAVSDILRDRVSLLLFAIGFLLMGSFVTVFNYVTFRLVAPPFDLSQTAVGLIFLLYASGIVGSPWIGSLAGRLGPHAMLLRMLSLMALGLVLTIPDALLPVLVGLALLTFGFFSGHSVASGWVSQRARTNRAMAASLYLFAYYVGSAVPGSLGGILWDRQGWPGVVALTLLCTSAALVLVIILKRSRGHP
ncbi:MAG: MFS transporter [Rhodobacteraceae bacterium]|nr:MFS transporter [Paracoccaceae bacterium]